LANENYDTKTSLSSVLVVNFVDGNALREDSLRSNYMPVLASGLNGAALGNSLPVSLAAVKPPSQTIPSKISKKPFGQ
jgi:hypothetical protein